MFPQTASLSLKLPLKCCNTSVSFFTLGGIIWSTGAKSTENGIFQWKATIFVIISFLISTKATLNNNAKEWVIHLMSTLTGQDASFLTSTLTSGSAEELQGSATRAFQDSPTARPRLAFGPPASKSPPITISVPGQGHWHKSITLISLDGIGILIAPVAKWVLDDWQIGSGSAKLCLCRKEGRNLLLELWESVLAPSSVDDCHGLFLRLTV